MGFQPDQQEVGHCLEHWNGIKKAKIWHKFCWVRPATNARCCLATQKRRDGKQRVLLPIQTRVVIMMRVIIQRGPAHFFLTAVHV